MQSEATLKTILHNSYTGIFCDILPFNINGLCKSKDLERAKGFEPSTPTLARLCSTPELRPLWRLTVRITAGKARY